MITKYVIISDNSGHDYLVPLDKKDEAQELYQAIERYWEDSEAEGECPEEPDYAIRMDGQEQIGYGFVVVKLADLVKLEQQP